MMKVRQVHITHTSKQMQIYAHTRIYTVIHIHMNTCAHIYTSIYTHAYIHIHIYTHTHSCTYIRIHTHTHVSKLLSKYFQFQESLNLELSIQNTYRGIHFFGGLQIRGLYMFN